MLKINMTEIENVIGFVHRTDYKPDTHKNAGIRRLFLVGGFE